MDQLSLDDILATPAGQRFVQALRTTPKEFYLEVNNKRNGHLIREFVRTNPEDAKMIEESYEQVMHKPLFELARAILDYDATQERIKRNEEYVKESEGIDEIDMYLSKNPDVVSGIQKIVNDLGKERAIEAIRDLEHELEEKIQEE